MSLRNIIHVRSLKWICKFIEHLWYFENYQKPRQGKTRQDQARQDKTMRHPDKIVSPGFEKYCSGSLFCWKRIGGVLFRTIFIESSFIAHCKHFYFILIIDIIWSCRLYCRLSIRDCGFIFCSGVVCGRRGVSSEEGATRGTGFSGVISSNVSNRVRQ